MHRRNQLTSRIYGRPWLTSTLVVATITVVQMVLALREVWGSSFALAPTGAEIAIAPLWLLVQVILVRVVIAAFAGRRNAS